MGKNNAYINMVRDAVKAKKHYDDTLNEKIDQLAPTIYAAFVLALHRKEKWGFKRIERILLETQVIWETNGREIIKTCMEETGIPVMCRKQYEEEFGDEDIH